MGVFDDKKFESLDWISQATEPVESRLNTMLNLLPDSFNISFKDYVCNLDSYWSKHIVTIDSILKNLLKDNSLYMELSYVEKANIAKCFNFEITGSPIIDFEKQEIRSGTVCFVKHKGTMDEDLLKAMLGKRGIDSVYSMYDGEPNCCSRANEIMSLLGECEDGLSTKSFKKKRKSLVKRLGRIFKENEWKIRDTELANKIGFWITRYVEKGDKAALSNICKVKIMASLGNPIYSIKEV